MIFSFKDSGSAAATYFDGSAAPPRSRLLVVALSTVGHILSQIGDSLCPIIGSSYAFVLVSDVCGIVALNDVREPIGGDKKFELVGGGTIIY